MAFALLIKFGFLISLGSQRQCIEAVFVTVFFEQFQQVGELPLTAMESEAKAGRPQ